MAHGKMSEEVRKCIEDCIQCYRICTETVQHCLKMGGKHAEASHIGELLDCARICDISAEFMLRSSRFQHEECRICADVCRACAESCNRLAEGDRLMLDCADTCRRCAASCDRMAAVPA